MSYISPVTSLFGRPEREQPWEKLEDTPEQDHGHKPQGLTHVDGDTIMAVHRNDTETVVYRYDHDTQSFEELGLMPEEARHTSGLGSDGTHIWALDYASRTIYRFRKDRFLHGDIEPEQTWDAGLNGASGLEYIPHETGDYLAVSNFVLAAYGKRLRLPTGGTKSYILPVEALHENPEAKARDLAITSFEHGGYSQGLVYDDGYLFESVNQLPQNQVTVRTIGQDGSVDHITSFNGPGRGIEDMAVRDQHLYVSDELQYSFYRTDLGDLALPE